MVSFTFNRQAEQDKTIKARCEMCSLHGLDDRAKKTLYNFMSWFIPERVYKDN